MAWLRPSWPQLVGLVALLAATVSGGRLLRDPDSYWHVAAGRWIIENGTVPTRDPFAWSVHDAPWTAHEWLWDVVVQWVFELGNWPAVGVMSALTLAATLAVMMRYLVDHMKPLRAIVLVLLAGLTLEPHALARPHGFALLLLAAWTAGLLRATDEYRPPSWWLALLMVPWSNSHASFVFGLALAGALGLDALLKAAPGQRRRLAWGWLRFGVLAALASQINPVGIDALLYPLNTVTMSDAGALIGEWKPPVVARSVELEAWLLGLVGIGLLLRPRLSPIRVLVLLGLLHMTLHHVRHADLLAVVAPLLLAKSLDEAAERASGNAPPIRLDRWFEALGPRAHVLGVLVSTTALLLALWPMATRNIEPARAITPAAAVDAGLQLPGHVFNHYDYGGYLIFRGVPVFIDGRGDPYGNAFTQAAIKAVLDGTDLLDLLDRHGAAWTLLPASSAAVATLDRSEGWLRYYTDDVTVVHRRVTPTPDSASP